jgi:hypothetical protein
MLEKTRRAKFQLMIKKKSMRHLRFKKRFETIAFAHGKSELSIPLYIERNTRKISK